MNMAGGSKPRRGNLSASAKASEGLGGGADADDEPKRRQRLGDKLLAPERSLLPRCIEFVPASSSKDAVDAGSGLPANASGAALLSPAYHLYSRERLRSLCSDRSLRPVGRGLVNGGNTCFLNSILQVLTYTRPLQNYLYSKEHTSACEVYGTGGFCAMCLFEAHVCEVLRSGRSAVDPQGLLKRLNQIGGKSMRLGKQEDAHEFMSHFIHACHKSLLRPAIARAEVPLAVQRTSLLHQIFGGFLRSQVTCLDCGHETNTFDPFLDLCLEVQHASVEKALHGLMRSEKVVTLMPYRCKRCQVDAEVTKKFIIQRLPPFLALQLKRFDYSRNVCTKVVKPVAFGPTIDMSPFTCTKDKACYKLYAVVVHTGQSARSGHYFAFIRHESGAWYQFDDETVRLVSEQIVLRAQAYLLFYESEQLPYPDIEASAAGECPVADALAAKVVPDYAGEVGSGEPRDESGKATLHGIGVESRLPSELKGMGCGKLQRKKRKVARAIPVEGPPSLATSTVANGEQAGRRKKKAKVTVTPDDNVETNAGAVAVLQSANVSSGPGRSAEEREKQTVSDNTQFGLAYVSGWVDGSDTEQFGDREHIRRKGSDTFREAQRRLQPLPQVRDELDAEYDVGKKKHKPKRVKEIFDCKNAFDAVQRHRSQKVMGGGRPAGCKGKGKGGAKGKGKVKGKGFSYRS